MVELIWCLHESCATSIHPFPSHSALQAHQRTQHEQVNMEKPTLLHQTTPDVDKPGKQLRQSATKLEKENALKEKKEKQEKEHEEKQQHHEKAERKPKPLPTKFSDLDASREEKTPASTLAMHVDPDRQLEVDGLELSLSCDKTSCRLGTTLTLKLTATNKNAHPLLLCMGEERTKEDGVESLMHSRLVNGRGLLRASWRKIPGHARVPGSVEIPPKATDTHRQVMNTAHVVGYQPQQRATVASNQKLCYVPWLKLAPGERVEWSYRLTVSRAPETDRRHMASNPCYVVHGEKDENALRSEGGPRLVLNFSADTDYHFLQASYTPVKEKKGTSSIIVEKGVTGDMVSTITKNITDLWVGGSVASNAVMIKYENRKPFRSGSAGSKAKLKVPGSVDLRQLARSRSPSKHDLSPSSARTSRSSKAATDTPVVLPTKKMNEQCVSPLMMSRTTLDVHKSPRVPCVSPSASPTTETAESGISSKPATDRLTSNDPGHNLEAALRMRRSSNPPKTYNPNKSSNPNKNNRQLDAIGSVCRVGALLSTLSSEQVETFWQKWEETVRVMLDDAVNPI